jgi:putative tricarboxylic transport membrane protein
MTSADRLWGVVILILGGVYFFEGIRIPEAAIGDPLGPRTFPMILGVLMAACGAYLVVRPAARGAQPVLARSSFLRVLLLCALLLLYAITLPSLGYILATSLFLLGATLIMGERSFARGLAISAAFSGGIFLLFTRVLTIPLPLGLLKIFGFK